MKAFIHFILFSGLFCPIVSQVIPLELQEKLNYQEVKVVDIKGGFTIIESFAKYPNGIEGINDHISSNLKYPEDAREKRIEGVVVLLYTIGTNGFVANIQIQKGAHPLLEEEAVRVINLMGQWEPAYQRGRPVKSTYQQEFSFTLQPD